MLRPLLRQLLDDGDVRMQRSRWTLLHEY